MKYLGILLVVLFSSCSDYETICTFEASDGKEYKVIHSEEGIYTYGGKYDIIVTENHFWSDNVMVGERLPIFVDREVEYETYGQHAQDTIIKRWSKVQLEPEEIVPYLKKETDRVIARRIRYKQYAIEDAIEKREFIDKLKCE